MFLSNSVELTVFSWEMEAKYSSGVWTSTQSFSKSFLFLVMIKLIFSFLHAII
jgi:hypothetical protein